MSLGARYILAAVTCFSLVNLLVKALAHLPVEEVIFWRGFVCLFITYYMVRRLGLSPWGRNKKLLLMRGLCGTFALGFFFYTLHKMPLASAVTIQYLSPVFTVLVAGVFFGEKVQPVHWLCSLAGFGGVLIIQGFDPRVELGDALMGLGGAVCSAFAYNTVRSLRHSDHEWVVMFYFPLVASVVSAPFAFEKWVWPEGMDWAYIIAMGILIQIAQFFLTRGYSLEKASNVASMNYAGVLLAVFFGVLLYGETLPATTGTGMVVIMASVWISARYGTGKAAGDLSSVPAESDPELIWPPSPTWPAPSTTTSLGPPPAYATQPELDSPGSSSSAPPA